MSRIDADAFDALPSDARDEPEALLAAKRAEFANASSSGLGFVPVWLRVLRRLTSGRVTKLTLTVSEHARELGWSLDLCSVGYTLPVYDGDRPADITDEEIAEARSWEPEYRSRCRTRDQRALVFREAIHDRGRGDGYAASVRETHAVVHEALAGEPTPWCEWCHPVDNNKNP